MTEKKYERYYDLASKASFENWISVMNSKTCGCYCCGSIFPASRITDNDWTLDANGRTVLCPECGVDAVLGDASGIPIQEDVLKELHDRWFGWEHDMPEIHCVGSGNYNLDTIVVREYPDGPAVKRFSDKVVTEEVGGTCGNIMCLLSNFGFSTYPQACLDDSPEGKKIKADMDRYGCDTRFVTNRPDGGTTLLRVTHKQNPDGTPRIAVRAGSPGGSRFPKRKFLRARDEAPAFVEALTAEFIPDFYFFDVPAAGHRYIARALREKGTVVWFEPSSISTNADLEGVALSDVIKFSNEEVPDASFADGFRDKLFIQTLGKDGLRFKFRDGQWKTLPPDPVEKVMDTEGAGDCATAGAIYTMVHCGLLCFGELTEEDIVYILTEAQHFSAEKISRFGSKGDIEL
jgi:sugar/nucleoside kinase (ribokinase family)